MRKNRLKNKEPKTEAIGSAPSHDTDKELHTVVGRVKKLANHHPYRFGGGMVVAVLIVMFGVIHVTPLRYWGDPLGLALETVQLVRARDNVAKANAHLSIAEAKLEDVVLLRSESPGSAHLDGLITSMVEHDKMAMRYMDKAKNEGQDIRQLNLVKRLCDLLGEQDKVLASAHTELRDLHEFADELEGRVMNGQDIHSAMEEVKQGLDAAMHW